MRIDDAIELASFGDDLHVELGAEISAIDKQFRELMLDVSCPYEFAQNNAFLTIKWDVDGSKNEDTLRSIAYHLLHQYKMYLSEVFNLEADIPAQYQCTADSLPQNAREFVVKVRGEYAFAILHKETGIHKIIKRFEGHDIEYFISVEVTPDIEIELKPYDLRVYVDRKLVPSPFGMKYVDRHARTTHLGTGIEAQSSHQKSGLGNRILAARILAVRLYMHEQGALSNPNIIREYDLEKKVIRDKRLKKIFKYSDGIGDVLPEILEETLLSSINSMQ